MAKFAILALIVEAKEIEVIDVDTVEEATAYLENTDIFQQEDGKKIDDDDFDKIMKKYPQLIKNCNLVVHRCENNKVKIGDKFYKVGESQKK